MYELIHGDCLLELKSIADESMDTVLTDPPYGISYQSSWHKDPQQRKIKNDGKPFIWWIYDAYRVLKDGGCLMCFSRWDVQQVFIDALKLAGFNVKSSIVWDRLDHGMGDLKGAFAPRHDVCIFATKGKFAFYGKRPQDVVQCSRTSNKAGNVHPTEKPAPLLEYLIQHTTQVGQTVLDPFAGSGATLIACENLGITSIGIEIDKKYHELALHRLQELNTPTE
jgi:site-specific DNA-methyltransferase (adenine-specific)